MLDVPYADMIAPATIHQKERQQRPGVVLGCKQGGHARPIPWLLEMMMTRKIIFIIIIAVAVLMCARPGAAATKTEYFMDDYSVCSLTGYIDIPSGVTITIHLKKPGASKSLLTKCALRFRTESDKELLRIEYKAFEIRDCGISFKVNLNNYRCNAKLNDAKLSTREVDIELSRPLHAVNYGGTILLTTYQSNDPGPRDDSVSNPALIGVIVGSVCGVILLILLLAVIGICCYQRNSYLRGGHADPVLRDGDSSDMDKCYINNMEKNGSPVGGVGMSPSLRYTDVVEKFSDSKEEKNRDGLGVRNGEKPLVVDAFATTPTKSSEFSFDTSNKSRGGGSGDEPRSPMIEALQSNLKFQASYQSTENEAEKRAHRLSSTNNGGGGSGGNDDTPPTPPPPLPVISAPVPKMRTMNSTHAGIRRVPVRTSATSDDINLLERELLHGGQVRDEDGDPGIQVLKPDVVGGLATEVVPIKIQASKPKADVEIEDFDRTDLTNDDPPPFIRSTNSSTSTVHSLRPNRHRSPASKSKHQAQQQQGSASRNKDAGLSSLRKRGPKSPRITTKGRRLVSEAEEGSVYDDEQRADTPLSVMGVRSSRADDLESLPPLRRSASRQSLFASRSSLYSRRGKKERRPSVADSLDSYAQDDLTLCNSGAQTQPMSRQDARAFKSLGSIIAPTAAETSTSDPSYSTGRTRKKSVGTSSLSHGRQTPKKSTSSHKSSMSTQTSGQKSTQTDRGAAMNQQQHVHPVPLAKPLLKSTVKSVPPRNVGNGGADHSSQSVKLPPALSKSYFQPIAYNNNTNVTDPGLPPPPPTETLKSTKSPWELLCELTDTNTHTSPPSESGVSTPGPRLEPNLRFTAPSAQLMSLSLTPGPYTAQTTTIAPVTSQPLAGNNATSTHSPFVTTTVTPLNPSVTPTSARYTPSSLVGSEISFSSHPPMTMDPNYGTLPTRKSSWDALTELADNQMPSASHQNVESIV
ncbi:uncharacterized protein LOC106868301 [Octopus bimaculoides]|uniref:Uncharacterized protein n=1 Tax=Octopus bimaculoides TaxID=37653 RepID=A0A0L8HVR1_OCTBM|nr:uncharacterized protein LOC106868301 [Octopus bimaculoides]XP_014768977.1 uncharacterized protein LOC106868301 [Octopus bimaculoides]|eukprot:XP_014768975.1 PREDICTED: uncharacterized protein LOC106868301 [Octopus bimaculoides]